MRPHRSHGRERDDAEAEVVAACAAAQPQIFAEEVGVLGHDNAIGHATNKNNAIIQGCRRHHHTYFAIAQPANAISSATASTTRSAATFSAVEVAFSCQSDPTHSRSRSRSSSSSSSSSSSVSGSSAGLPEA